MLGTVPIQQFRRDVVNMSNFRVVLLNPFPKIFDPSLTVGKGSWGDLPSFALAFEGTDVLP